MLNKVRVFIIVFFVFFLTCKMMLSVSGVDIMDVNNREILTYELLNIEIDKGNENLILEGWAFLQNSQHFLDQSTHAFYIQLNEKETYPALLKNTDLSKIMEYRGYRQCNINEMNKKDCNYLFKNVGFKVSIPLEDLRVGDNTFSIIVDAFKINKRYRSSLFYADSLNKSYNNNEYQYKIDSEFHRIKLKVFYHTLLVRTKPEPFTSSLELGAYCSNYYENTSYFKKDSIYYNVLDKSMFNDLVSYYKVMVKQDICQDNKRRVVEGTLTDYVAFIPSTYVNYQGKALVVSKKELQSKPIILASDLYLNQYNSYDPWELVSVFDMKDKDINNKLKITYNDVNVKLPGIYKTCYHVTNKFLHSSNSCRNVIVNKINTNLRFINEDSYAYLNEKSLWNNEDYKRILKQSLKK